MVPALLSFSVIWLETLEHLPTSFEDFAKKKLATSPHISCHWETLNNGDKRRLVIMRQNEGGFDIVIECETYGLYPFAGEWHGSPWEWFQEESLEEFFEQFMGFIRTLLSKDAMLEVKYSNKKPYKWFLTYETEQDQEKRETGLFLYNYFGSRSAQVFQNDQLPQRYGLNAI